MLPGRCLVWTEDVTPSLSGLVGVGAETFPRHWSGEGRYCKQASKLVLYAQSTGTVISGRWTLLRPPGLVYGVKTTTVWFERTADCRVLNSDVTP